MNVKGRTLAHLVALLLITACLASCNQPAEINVACDVSDLIQAINTANANPDSTKLVLAANCTYPFTAADNQDGGHGGNALPLITTRITIEGNDAILQRVSGPQYRFFLITTGSLRIDDLTLQDGYSIAMPDEVLRGGGAIYNDVYGTLTLNHVLFRNNRNLSYGGAILNLGVLIADDDCAFEDNSAELGGAIYNTGENDTPLTIYNTTFTGNRADSGGALYNIGPDTNILIGGVEFRANSANYDGGAIYSDGGQMRIADASFVGNTALHHADPIGRGGAIYKGDGEMSISDTKIEENSAYQQGGGIFNAADSLSLDHCQLYYNRLRYHSDAVSSYGGGVGDGGGIYNLGDLEVESSTFGSNRATVGLYGFGTIGGNGGGIYNDGVAILTNSTLGSNSAMEGGGVYSTGILHILNCTFGENKAVTTGSAIYNSGFSAIVEFSTFYHNTLGSTALSVVHLDAGTFTVKNSLLSDNYSSNCLVQGGTFNAVGDNLSGDTSCPGFTIQIPGYVLPSGGFSDHGGPTYTVSILSTSAAFNSADCYTSINETVTRDQRGVSRPQPSFSACDLGAFELETEGGMTSPGAAFQYGK